MHQALLSSVSGAIQIKASDRFPPAFRKKGKKYDEWKGHTFCYLVVTTKVFTWEGCCSRTDAFYRTPPLKIEELIDKSPWIPLG